MDTLSAIARGQAALAAGAKMKVFDWNKAAQMIADKKILNARAGLQFDMEYTAGTILKNGEPVFDDYTFLASNWATPVIEVDGDETPCWSYEGECGFNSDTKWPDSALQIIGKTRPANT